MEAAVRGRVKRLRRGFQHVGSRFAHAAGGELVAGDTGAADLALGCAGVVLERVQQKRALRGNEQRGKEQARQ